MIKKQHILVTGAHRSGTTWVGQTIAQYPSIHYLQEPFNVDLPHPVMNLKLNTWFTDWDSSDQQQEIKAAFDQVLNMTHQQVLMQSLKASAWDVNLMARQVAKYLLRKSTRERQCLIKDPIALLSADWLYEQYDLKVICMIRNPFAFVGSLKKANWNFDFRQLNKQGQLMQGLFSPFAEEVAIHCQPSAFIDRACLLWNMLHYAIVDYQKRYPNWLFLPYEEIAADPLNNFQSVFDYLELEMSPSIVQ